MRALELRLPVLVGVAWFLVGPLAGCRSSDELGVINTEPVAASGGKGGRGTGGRSGSGGRVGAASGGSPASGAGGAGGTVVVDNDASASDVTSAPGPDSAGAGAGPDSGPADAVASDAKIDGPPVGANGIAICWPDPKVIKICHQLENACENCPPGGAPPGNKLAATCFDLIKKAYAGMATDADCEKFAIDNKCPVDNPNGTGNVCGSLNCYAPGCSDKERCLNRQQWGASNMCAPFMATCGPCK